MRKVFLIPVLLIFAALSLSNSTYMKAQITFTAHDPICIRGDTGFTAENGITKGSGTREDPYVIDGWEIRVGTAEYGIYIEKTTTYFAIRSCKIVGEGKAAGIYIKNVTNGTVIDCDITKNNGGIKIKEGKAIEIAENNLELNHHGIIAEGTEYLRISKNKLALNTFGILLSGVTAAKVTGNTIELNDWNGIYVDATSTLNTFFHNNLVENKIAPAWDQGLNNWNSESEGNYWDDYQGEDKDGDGIGDIPHRILGHGSSGENYDYYPLMEPWKEG